MASAKFTVCPSEWYENNPLNVIESLYLSIPVLGANIGGIPELIEQGANGELFESKNESDLKEKIEIMINDEYNFDKFQVVEKFEKDAHLETLNKIYEGM
jgi:glycosyltransferase involved in cell wall biosynthesis